MLENITFTPNPPAYAPEADGELNCERAIIVFYFFCVDQDSLGFGQNVVPPPPPAIRLSG